MNTKNFFPPIITQHAKAKMPIDGINSHLIDAGEQQFIFMEFNEDTEIGDHSHEAQWGVVLEGEMDLKIYGELKKLKKGDSYYIPKDTIHSAKIKAGYKDLTLFNEKERYQFEKQL